MAKTSTMMCPQCGIEMNYHAEKVDYLAALTDPDTVDPELGRIVEEVHTCPGCGNMATRKASTEGEYV